MARTARAVRSSEPPTLELVLKRNSIERLKREKSPLGIARRAARTDRAGYETSPRRTSSASSGTACTTTSRRSACSCCGSSSRPGILTPPQLRVDRRALARASAANAGELSTRQTVQLHWLRLGDLPDVFAASTRPGYDRGRLRRRRPQHHRLPGRRARPRRAVRRDARDRRGRPFFYGNRDYRDLPRKHKITISACAHQCNAPEINCIALVGAIQRRASEGFAVQRRRRPLVHAAASPAISASSSEGRGAGGRCGRSSTSGGTISRYRVSRAKARLKFLVDDYGAEGMRAGSRSGSAASCEDLALPPVPAIDHDHMGVNAQKQRRPGLRSASRSSSARSTATQMVALADLAEVVRRRHPRHAAAELHPHRRPGASAVDEVPSRAWRDRLPGRRQPAARQLIACTGQPLCNYAVAETKPKLPTIVEPGARGSATPSTGSSSTSTAARTPARTTGSATSASRARTVARRRAAAASRHTRSTCAAASAATRRSDGRSSAASGPASRRRGRRPRRGLARAAPRSRELSAVRPTGSATRSLASWQASSRRRHTRQRGGEQSHEHRHLIDDLEAGELAVEYDDREPQEADRVGARPFGDRLAVCTSFQEDGMAILDMAWRSTRTSASSRSIPAGCRRRRST